MEQVDFLSVWGESNPIGQVNAIIKDAGASIRVNPE